MARNNLVRITRITKYLSSKQLWKFIDENAILNPKVLVRFDRTGSNGRRVAVYALVRLLAKDEIATDGRLEMVKEDKIKTAIRGKSMS